MRNWYVTYNDLPNGIFKSQVVDTVNFINKEAEGRLRLISFVSIRGFFKNRNSVKSWHPEAVVLPMFPGVLNWRLSSLLLLPFLLIDRPKVFIGRGVFAVQLGLLFKKLTPLKRVVYDGRGAVHAEWKEFSFSDDSQTLQTIFKLEKQAVLKADFRIAVSEALATHWREKFGFHGEAMNEYVVVPCTVGSQFLECAKSADEVSAQRVSLNIPIDATVLVYSGAVQGWQSTKTLVPWFEQMLHMHDNVFVLLLTKETEEIRTLMANYPNRVQRRWLHPNEVPEMLAVADYGVLLRDEYVTNKVASPTKFAEYLVMGLRMIISPNIGDFSSMTSNDKLGLVLSDFEVPEVLPKPSIEMKQTASNFARTMFSKNRYKEAYRVMIK